MEDEQLILGVLAAQAGFATPAQVVAAASARLLARDGRDLLEHLLDAGVLTRQQRDLVSGLAREAIVTQKGDATEALRTLGGATAVEQTFGASFVAGGVPPPSPEGEREVPTERERQYSRLNELGRGGQSIVWRVIDEFIGREVALKELLPEIGRGAGQNPSATAARQRFMREVRLAARLDHPGIVPIHDLARRADGTLFCTQKLIRGENLKLALARTRSLKDRLALLPHVVDACQAIAYAHSRGVVHRDLKPSNIMVGEFGETVVVDWGLAKERGTADPLDGQPSIEVGPELTVAGVALGTPAYMSPEQARGDVTRIDTRSDVFSLGAVLYEVITGRPPFEGATNTQIIEKVRAGQVIPVRSLVAEAPPELAAICERALQPEPERRYEDAAALAEELSAFRAGGRVAAYHYGTLDRFRKFVGRHRVGSAAAAAALAVLLASSGVIAFQLHRARLNLSSALLERAADSERSYDWARAAGYYAASRIEHDTAQARWSYALARERIPHRSLARRGSARSMRDLGFLPDGTMWTLSTEAQSIVARTLDGSRELWRHPLSDALIDVAIADGYVKVFGGRTREYLELTTGRVLARFDRTRAPCAFGPPSERALTDTLGVLRLSSADGTALAQIHLLNALCAVSPDGQRVAFLDSEGNVRLWDLALGREIAVRPAPDTSLILSTAHGLALVRSGSIQVFGGSEGDFNVQLPARAPAAATGASLRDAAVSPDGQLLAVASATSSQTDLIDLRDRAVFASVSYPPGLPKLTFSPDGRRLLASDLVDGALVLGWDLTRPRPIASASGKVRFFFNQAANGRRFFAARILEPQPYYEIRESDGRLVRSADLGNAVSMGLSGDGRRLALGRPDGLEVIDADSGAVVGRVDCKDCRRVNLSEDGSRLLGKSRSVLGLWNVDPPKLLWSEPERKGTLHDSIAMSRDGRTVCWIWNGRALVHGEGTSADIEFSDEREILHASLNRDGTAIAIATAAQVSVWDVARHRRRWATANTAWGNQVVDWSGDDSALLLEPEALGTVLLDARTGERLVSIGLSKPGTLKPSEDILGDLRHRLSRGGATWELHDLPPPDEGDPRASLRRVLTEAGLELRGVELLDVLPSP